jgi:branched-chain amino acid transport system permease protein
MLAALLTVLFDGVAYGSVLFVISVGMSVTIGLMNFINLAHGAFAMFGGYLAIWLMTHAGLPFAATLPAVMVAFAVVGLIVERVLYRRVSRIRSCSRSASPSWRPRWRPTSGDPASKASRCPRC